MANSAKEALKQLSAAPDPILLDIKMPGMNGFPFLHSVVTEEETVQNAEYAVAAIERNYTSLSPKR